MKVLTLSQLESHLWQAANILRGAIDAADYKHYIFGLLFFKRLCDVWEEEYEDRMAEYGCVQANEAEIGQAVENAWSNLMALIERGDMEFDRPEDIAHVAEQMIRASMDHIGITDVVGLKVACVGVE